jgi:hypothetical protein
MKIETSAERATSLRGMLYAGVIDKSIYEYLKFRCTDLGRDSNARDCLKRILFENN